jgi:hypothetical protein
VLVAIDKQRKNISPLLDLKFISNQLVTYSFNLFIVIHPSKLYIHIALMLTMFSKLPIPYQVVALFVSQIQNILEVILSTSWHARGKIKEFVQTLVNWCFACKTLSINEQ